MAKQPDKSAEKQRPDIREDARDDRATANQRESANERPKPSGDSPKPHGDPLRDTITGRRS
jgi:hypothetical protein